MSVTIMLLIIFLSNGSIGTKTVAGEAGAVSIEACNTNARNIADALHGTAITDDPKVTVSDVQYVCKTVTAAEHS